ncbi:hypothetical protein CEP64_14105 (plasmid) [Mammaliicoccus sciuri]|uniref:Uncharacterized protein n=1 Tax=Mammaliicoccus sciuri TaxID=1296 RepID=A0AAI8IDR1_MAMSC|nr:hypothetical protein CEP64_14105 [Mammaliicoccus sciuri]
MYIYIIIFFTFSLRILMNRKLNTSYLFSCIVIFAGLVILLKNTVNNSFNLPLIYFSLLTITFGLLFGYLKGLSFDIYFCNINNRWMMKGSYVSIILLLCNFISNIILKYTFVHNFHIDYTAPIAFALLHFGSSILIIKYITLQKLNYLKVTS